MVMEVNRTKTMMIDESLLSPDEAEKILARRAYNRDCATRARKRSKLTVAHLEKQVKELQQDKEALRRSLVVMGKQMVELESQNKALKLQQMLPATNPGIGNGMIADPNSVGSATMGSGFFPTTSLLQLAHQQQQWHQMRQEHAAISLRGAGGGTTIGIDLEQLSRYMKAKNGYF